MQNLIKDDFKKKARPRTTCYNSSNGNTCIDCNNSCVIGCMGTCALTNTEINTKNKDDNYSFPQKTNNDKKD